VDDRALRRDLEVILRRAGYDVLLAANLARLLA
jgi:hypothetical protein